MIQHESHEISFKYYLMYYLHEDDIKVKVLFKSRRKNSKNNNIRLLFFGVRKNDIFQEKDFQFFQTNFIFAYH